MFVQRRQASTISLPFVAAAITTEYPGMSKADMLTIPLQLVYVQQP